MQHLFAITASLLVCQSASALADVGEALPTPPPQVVRIQTVDGREISGVVDVRSDARTLWLRMENAVISLSVATSWDSVRAAEIDGVRMTANELALRYAAMASEGPKNLVPEAIVPAAHRLPAGPATASAGSAHARTRVRNLEIVHAELVNLDHDVEPDGITISVAAVGDNDLPVAVRGTLRARLHGERWAADEPSAKFGELGDWSERVRPKEFVDGVATFKLWFRSVSPEWEFDLMPDAILSAELGVFGQGNFAASTPVVVRPLNPVRDDLQQWHGQRFFPTELRQRPVRSHLYPPNGRWIHWTW